MRLLLLLGMFLTVSGCSCACAASQWQSFAYRLSGFVAGAGDGAIQVRDGYLPVPAGAPQLREDRLPEGTGALALFCFQQRSGGKLKGQAGFAPMGGVAVTVTGNSLTLAARTDASGYLILALPPGSYQLHLFGLSKTVQVESGTTALVATRGGKRMVD